MAVLIKNGHITKKNILMNYKPIYMHYIDKFLNERNISNLEDKRVREFIKTGCDIFIMKEEMKQIVDKLKGNNFDFKKYNIKIKVN